MNAKSILIFMVGRTGVLSSYPPSPLLHHVPRVFAWLPSNRFLQFLALHPFMKPVPPKRPNWIPLPDAIKESEVKIELTWSADARTQKAIERQAAIMGFESPTAYLLQALAAVIAGNEEDTVLRTDGRLVHGSTYAYGRSSVPRDG